MPDLALIFGTDLLPSNSGDLTLFSAGDYATQRVVRRLLTNPGDYIWQPAYGAGLAAFIGQPTNVATIAAVSRLQMRLEPIVAQSPEPVVTITATDDGAVYETVQFVSTATDEALSVLVGMSTPSS